MGTDSTASQLLPGHFNEAVKTYSVFDGSNRLEFFYVAGVDIEAGELCMVTQYAYDGASTRIQKSKEDKATWQAAWEI